MRHGQSLACAAVCHGVAAEHLSRLLPRCLQAGKIFRGTCAHNRGYADHHSAGPRDCWPYFPAPYTSAEHSSTVSNRDGTIPPDQKATVLVPLQCVPCPCRARPSMHSLEAWIGFWDAAPYMAFPAGGRPWRRETGSTQRATTKLSAPKTSRPGNYTRFQAISHLRHPLQARSQHPQKLCLLGEGLPAGRLAPELLQALPESHPAWPASLVSLVRPLVATQDTSHQSAMCSRALDMRCCEVTGRKEKAYIMCSSKAAN